MSVDIALCADRRILPGLVVTVRSALEHTSTLLNVHVISVGLLDDDKEKLRKSWSHPKCGQIIFSELATNKIQHFRSTAYLQSKVTYARYFISELFPNLKRYIYLDSDLLVFRDLAEAFQIDLCGNLIAAVRDVGVRTKPLDPALRRRLGLHNEANYFNAGFIVIDADSWRCERLTEKLVAVSIERFDDLHAVDQDALNMLLEDRVLLINEVWNTWQYEKPNPLAGHVVHLVGTIKPWHLRYADKFFEAYYEDVIFASFQDVLSRTEYRDWQPWNFAGLGRYAEWLIQHTPTTDMVVGKLRRLTARVIARNKRD